MDLKEIPPEWLGRQLVAMAVMVGEDRQLPVESFFDDIDDEQMERLQEAWINKTDVKGTLEERAWILLRQADSEQLRWILMQAGFRAVRLASEEADLEALDDALGEVRFEANLRREELDEEEARE